MTERSKEPRRFIQWIITIDGRPVVGTNAYGRKQAIGYFRVEADCTWRQLKAAGYGVARVEMQEPR